MQIFKFAPYSQRSVRILRSLPGAPYALRCFLPFCHGAASVAAGRHDHRRAGGVFACASAAAAASGSGRATRGCAAPGAGPDAARPHRGLPKRAGAPASGRHPAQAVVHRRRAGAGRAGAVPDRAGAVPGRLRVRARRAGAGRSGGVVGQAQGAAVPDAGPARCGQPAGRRRRHRHPAPERGRSHRSQGGVADRKAQSGFHPHHRADQRPHRHLRALPRARWSPPIRPMC